MTYLIYVVLYQKVLLRAYEVPGLWEWEDQSDGGLVSEALLVGGSRVGQACGSGLGGEVHVHDNYSSSNKHPPSLSISVSCIFNGQNIVLKGVKICS